MEKNHEVGQTSAKWKTGNYWAKTGMNILLVVIIGVSTALCVSSFYFNEVFSGYTYHSRLWMQVLAVVAITLYTEFVYRFVFAKWAYKSGVGMMFALSIFTVFMTLGLITFVVFLWFSLVQWWQQGTIGLGILPVVTAVGMFLLFLIRRVIEA